MPAVAAVAVTSVSESPVWLETEKVQVVLPAALPHTEVEEAALAAAAVKYGRANFTVFPTAKVELYLKVYVMSTGELTACVLNVRESGEVFATPVMASEKETETASPEATLIV